MRILIIEDEIALADALQQILQKNKYLTDAYYKIRRKFLAVHEFFQGNKSCRSIPNCK